MQSTICAYEAMTMGFALQATYLFLFASFAVMALAMPAPLGVRGESAARGE